MTKYVIHTQDKNLSRIKEILHSHLLNTGYTIRKAEGFWKGKEEYITEREYNKRNKKVEVK